MQLNTRDVSFDHVSHEPLWSYNIAEYITFHTPINKILCLVKSVKKINKYKIKYEELYIKNRVLNIYEGVLKSSWLARFPKFG